MVKQFLLNEGQQFLVVVAVDLGEDVVAFRVEDEYRLAVVVLLHGGGRVHGR